MDLEHLLRKMAKKEGEQDGRVLIVNGPPGSGKSTYARNESKKGDLIVDLDELCCGLRGDGRLYGDNEPILSVALAARKAIYNEIAARRGKWNRAFVVTAEKDREKVDELANLLQGRVVRMETSVEECIDRIEKDERREDKEVFINLAKGWIEDRE